jgi:organic hydroperoxide reductase OsmC/OhrA
MSTHTAIVQWERDNALFSDNRYSRAHTWRFDGGVTVAASASPHVVPLPLSAEAAVDPEEAFVAALASCHLLWFLSIAAKAGFVVDHYADHAEGTMGVNAAGKQAVVTVTLRPRVTFVGARGPSPEEHLALHEAAHAECFIANSVTTVVRVEPDDAASAGPHVTPSEHTEAPRR